MRCGGPTGAMITGRFVPASEWTLKSDRIARMDSPPAAVAAGCAASARQFPIVLIKPSHYDDDGYVIRWHLSPMPANSLASVYGLIDDCARRQILGPETDIEIIAIDETNTRARIER